MINTATSIDLYLVSNLYCAGNLLVAFQDAKIVIKGQSSPPFVKLQKDSSQLIAIQPGEKFSWKLRKSSIGKAFTSLEDVF